MTARFLNLWKEQFSFAHVHALAAQAGCGIQGFEVDTDSVDCQIFRPGVNRAGVDRPVLDLQLKCTTMLGSDRSGRRYFDLPVKNYNELRESRRYIARVLAVIEVPLNEDDWIHCGDREICLRHRAYWADLLGEPETSNTESVRVTLDQLLSPDVLRQIMETLNHDGEWQ